VIWFLSALICVLLTALAFVSFDVPIARRVFGILWSAKTWATGFASAVLLAIEAAIALTLVIVRIMRLHETILLACLTSI
jgi:hypothetical protein